MPQEQKITSEEGISQVVVLISLTKEYTQSKKTAVKDLSFTFYRDQITALLGPNGAGKTMVMYVHCLTMSCYSFFHLFGALKCVC